MNATEVANIKTTWATVQANPTDSGCAILVEFLTKYPSNLEKFPWFKDIAVDELKENARFRTHANRIIKVFEDSISALGDGDKLNAIWLNLAETHFKRQIEPKAFNELKQSILTILTAACKLNGEQVAAWTKLIDTVYAIVFERLAKLKAGQ